MHLKSAACWILTLAIGTTPTLRAQRLNPLPRAAAPRRRPTHRHRSQGKHAAGGARDYCIDGNMIGGFAMIAWLAGYLSSGLKTFVCNMDGIGYERNFGRGTGKAVAGIGAYDPGPGWSKAKPWFSTAGTLGPVV